MTNLKINPCPQCDSDYLKLHYFFGSQIECKECGFMGLYKKSPSMFESQMTAIDEWNRMQALPRRKKNIVLVKIN